MALDIKAIKKARENGSKGEAPESAAKRWTKFIIIVTLYLLFLLWVGSWMGLIVVPFIYDVYISKKIPWTWWKELEGDAGRFVMSWVDAIVFALVAVYFVNNFFFQNYQIPSSSLEKTLLTGDYLLVSKVSYGPRIPQTPLTLPLTQHTLPFFDCKSYLETPHWDYRRVKGLGNVEMGDIVVFNYPSGDTVALNRQNTDFYSYCVDEAKRAAEAQGISIPKMSTLSTWEQRKQYEQLYSLGKQMIENDPNTYGEIVSRPADRRENYVKRCVGLPGQTLQIKNKIIYIDGKAQPTPEEAQFAYMVKAHEDLTQAKFDELCNRLGISDEQRSEWNIYGGMMPLTKTAREELLKCDAVDAIEEIMDGDFGTMYPLNHDYGWTRDNYGPIHIPAKGETIKLTLDNIAIYERPIRSYEGNDLVVTEKEILINGKPASEYTFKMDYYWMMGDNRHNSADSRYWGFVPEDHVVGKPLFIWLSVSPDAYSNQPLRIRWNRLFKWVGKIN